MSKPIEKYLDLQKNRSFRWKIWTRSDRANIYVRDSDNRNRRISLKDKKVDNAEDCDFVWQKIISTGMGEWVENNITKRNSFTWECDYEAIAEFLDTNNKGSTNRNYLILLRNLQKENVPRTFKGILKWLIIKQYGTKPFVTRLDFLRQLQRFYRQRTGEYPSWFTYEKYMLQRQIHNEERKKLASNKKKQDAPVRGIATREKAEQFLDANNEEYPWQCWAVAMMMCYGLRNHELWYIKKLPNLFVEVPGRLTKSPEDHQTWPAFAYWIEKYGLFKNFDEYQNLLRSKRKAIIRSITDPKKTYSIDDPEIYEDGKGHNNSDLGDYITRNTLGVKYNSVKNGGSIRCMPDLLVKSPKKGSRAMIKVKPYDLRHTWAVTMATDPEFQRTKTLEECAEAMGHGVEVHRGKYLLWMDTASKNAAAIKSHVHPYAA